MPSRNWYSGKKIAPPRIGPGLGVRELVDETFLAYNGARLREACTLFVDKMLGKDVTVGLTISGALTPAGLGCSCLIPLIEKGMVDWIVSTGANLYHDTHFALGMDLHTGTPFVDDRELKKDEVIRIYDILFPFDVLLDTDRFYYQMLTSEEFHRTMGTAELHYLIGKYLDGRAEVLGAADNSLLVAAYRAGVPMYTSSPGDSSLGMNIAVAALEGVECKIDPSIDVNETAAIVYDATREGESAVVVLGGGSPKNFALQTEPLLQEIIGLPDRGHSYYMQFTDARPDTGGLSGATPAEAVSWGKVDPNKLPDSVVCYLDSTVALPLLTAYALDAHEGRPHKRLYDEREKLMDRLSKDAIAQLPISRSQRQK